MAIHVETHKMLLDVVQRRGKEHRVKVLLSGAESGAGCTAAPIPADPVTRLFSF
jgi:hypothetical protein